MSSAVDRQISKKFNWKIIFPQSLGGYPTCATLVITTIPVPHSGLSDLFKFFFFFLVTHFTTYIDSHTHTQVDTLQLHFTCVSCYFFPSPSPSSCLPQALVPACLMSRAGCSYDVLLETWVPVCPSAHQLTHLQLFKNNLKAIQHYIGYN